MRKRINIVFSTTRMWNVGDEFIYMGIKKILNALSLEFNVVVFNRHPSIINTLEARKTDNSYYGNQFLDNSFPLNDPDLCDYVIIAGSPAWTDKSSSRKVLEFAQKNKKRISFLGVGAHREYSITPLMSQLLKNQTDFFSVRDSHDLEKFRKYVDAVQLPCPALFCVDDFREKRCMSVETIALNFQNDKVVAHSVCTSVKNELIIFYKEVLAKRDAFIVCHYIDDFIEATKQFPRAQIRYSSDTTDYFEIYSDADLVVSPRVHGCGIAASMGIPSISVSHDLRGSTVEGFLSKIVKPSELHLDLIPEVVDGWSKNILLHKKDTFAKYLAMIRKSSLFDNLSIY